MIPTRYFLYDFSLRYTTKVTIVSIIFNKRDGKLITRNPGVDVTVRAILKGYREREQVRLCFVPRGFRCRAEQAVHLTHTFILQGVGTFPVRRNLGYRPVEHIGHDGNPVFIGIHVFQHFHESVPVRGKIVKRVIRVEQEAIQAPIVNFHREHTRCYLPSCP